MQQLKHGKWLWPVLALLLSGCPQKSPPPPMEVCIHDGVGGADCVEHDGSKLYRPPSAMANYWCTNQEDEAAYASWATGANSEEVSDQMTEIKKRIY